MEAVREILSFAEHQALFLSERYGCAIHCFAFRVQNYGSKCAPVQCYPRQPLQLSATCCHRIWKPLFFGNFVVILQPKHWTNDLKIWWNKHLQQRISLSLLQRLFASMMLHWRTDLRIHCRTVVWKWWSIATVQGLHNGAMTDRHGHQSVHIFELAGNHRNE